MQPIDHLGRARQLGFPGEEAQIVAGDIQIEAEHVGVVATVLRHHVLVARGAGLFGLHVVEIDVVADQPDEDLLALYSHHEVRTLRATRFWGELTGAKANMDPRNLEGYEEEIKAIMSALPPEQRLAGLPPEQVLSRYPAEQRLAGLPPEQLAARLAPEQRLAGLDRDHQALALPIEVLRMLPDDYFRSLSPEIQAELRRRLQGGSS